MMVHLIPHVFSIKALKNNIHVQITVEDVYLIINKLQTVLFFDKLNQLHLNMA